MPLGQSSNQEKNLMEPFVDPFKVPDLDDLYEQKKLNKGSSSQLNDIESQQMYNSLEQRLKAVEDRNVLKCLNPDDLRLVLDLVLPPSFKMLSFEKYNRTSCPEMHLIMYCNKMTAHAHNKMLLIHIFQKGLIWTTTEWYLRLKRNQVCT